MPSTIGTTSQKTLTDLTQMILLATSNQQMTKLLDEQSRLAAQIQVLIDKIWDEATTQYKNALDALKAANEMAEQAKEDLDKIASYIRKVGRALDVVAKLVAMAT